MLFTQSKFLYTTVLFLIIATSMPMSYAESRNRSKPNGPPAEAIKACVDLPENNACSFLGRRNDEIKGTCISLSKGDEKLVCAPEGGPPNEREKSD